MSSSELTYSSLSSIASSTTYSVSQGISSSTPYSSSQNLSSSTTYSSSQGLSSSTTYSVIKALSSSKTSSSYTGTFTPSIPTGFNPFVDKRRGENGSIFIIFGTIIISLLVGILLTRLWFWLKNRRATEDDKLFEDYYGGSNGFMKYDSDFVNKEKSSYNVYLESSPESGFSHASKSSTSSAGGQSGVDLNNLTSKPGRSLRGTSQSYVLPTKRNSFISPINALINESRSDASSDGMPSAKSKQFSTFDVTESSASDSIHTSKNVVSPYETRSRSISVLFNSNSPNLDSVGHSRAPSAHLDCVEKMVNQSLIDLNKSKQHSSSNEQSTKPKRSVRPASQVLDMLVLQELQ